MIGTTSNDNNRFDTEVVTFKYFWGFLDSSLVYCEIEVDLSWSKEWIISEILTIPRVSRWWSTF